MLASRRLHSRESTNDHCLMLPLVLVFHLDFFITPIQEGDVWVLDQATPLCVMQPLTIDDYS